MADQVEAPIDEQKKMGHVDIRTILIYAKNIDSKKKEVVNLV